MLPYSKEVIKLFTNPENAGSLDNPDATATEGSPACGDMIKLYLKVNPDSKVIEDIKFMSYGCASNIATASVITKIAKGKTIAEAKQIRWKDAEEQLGGLPAVKVHCAVLAVDALQTAIENYENEHGMLTEKKATDSAKIKKRLKHVIDPAKGVDVISSEAVTDYSVSEGVATVRMSYDSMHQFAKNLKEEIRERIEPLWDIKKVIVLAKDE